MRSPPGNDDAEIVAMAAISSALARLPDPDSRQRVLSYVLARYLPDGRISALSAAPASSSAQTSLPSSSVMQIGTEVGRELPGIARVTEAGDLRVTIRDLKARSGLDAAVRLATVAIYAHDRLTGKPLSSRKGLTPILKEWRLYDGNTRARLSKEKGILRDGDNLSLDAHSRQDAERYIADIQNADLKGNWKPK